MIEINKNSFFGNILRSTRHWSLYYKERLELLAKYCAVSILPERKYDLCDKPSTIQMPITYKCNFDCIMCGMRNLAGKKDFTAEEIGIILKDKLFENIEYVGVNGGEPFLKDDLVECIKVMVDTLPKLKAFNIISNGYFTDTILDKLKQMKEISQTKGVKVNISFSVDGVGEMQDYMRGKKNAWVNVNNTINAIRKNQKIYCDYMNVISTITKKNVYNIEEVELWSKKMKIDVAYNIATPNIRIDNYEFIEDFTIFNDEKARMMAQEFFYKKFMTTKSRKYFALYYYIKTRKRYAPCPCKYNHWVTLTPNASIGYCATKSKELGNALKESAYDIFNNNLEYLKELVANNCDSCSHYMYTLTKEGHKEYFKELLRVQKIVL